MDNTRWDKVQTLFHQTVQLPPGERRGFLEAQGGDDTALVSEVLTLLKEDASGGSMLDPDDAQIASQVVGNSYSKLPPFIQIGPYRVVKTLGEGGLGTVYLAERPDLGSQVAIKVLRAASVPPARRQRFAIEQRTLAQLNHPAIARLYDANTSPEGTPFFVMEYVDGVPISEFCRQRRVPVADRLRLFRAVCEPVRYAHQRAVIHCDLKPSNILVMEDGTVRVLDFGIAKRLESLGGSIAQTVAGLRPMTSAYAAPEEMFGEQVGIQADVYSLGVVLYEMLAGKLPFDLSKFAPAQAEQLLIEGVTERPSVAVQKTIAASGGCGAGVVASKAAWADLDVLCLTAIHKDIEQRYQSVEALVRDVEHYLKGEPLEARPDRPSYRLRKFITRNWPAVTVAAAVFTVLATLVVFLAFRIANARVAARAEAARTQRIQRLMTDLFQGGDADAGPADNLRVVTLLDRGVLEAQSLNTEPEVQAELYQTLGALYQHLGKFDQANSLLNSALTLRKSIFGFDHLQVAESLVALGLLRDDQGQLPEAERLIREGVAMTRRHAAPNHPSVAKAITALGKALVDRGSYGAAIVTLDEAVGLQSTKDAPTPELTATLSALADAHFYAGHYAISQSLNERLLPIYRQTYGELHPRVADILINLGAIQFDLGHYPEAEKFEGQALGIVQDWYGKDNPGSATALTILGRTLIFEKRYDEGVNLLQQSLAIKERAFGKVHPSVASSLNDLGDAASNQGKYDVAERYFRREADIYRTVYGERHYLFATALSNLATVYMGRHEWKRAEEVFRAVIPIYVQAQSPDNINTGMARIKLGAALLHQNRYAEAETQTRAGYDILIVRMDPKVSWLVNARKDLVEEYSALKQPDQAARFRAEIAAVEAKPTEVLVRN